MPLKLNIRRKLTSRSDRVKSVDLHPDEPWMLCRSPCSPLTPQLSPCPLAYPHASYPQLSILSNHGCSGARRAGGCGAGGWTRKIEDAGEANSGGC